MLQILSSIFNVYYYYYYLVKYLMNQFLIKMQDYYKNAYCKCVISILAIAIYKKYISFKNRIFEKSV